MSREDSGGRVLGCITSPMKLVDSGGLDGRILGRGTDGGRDDFGLCETRTYKPLSPKPSSPVPFVSSQKSPVEARSDIGYDSSETVKVSVSMGRGQNGYLRTRSPFGV